MDSADLPEASVPLKEVVADCARRWFQDALMEARAGDVSMQVLVAQMYRCGYGVAKNEQKVNPLCCSPGNGSFMSWHFSGKCVDYKSLQISISSLEGQRQASRYLPLYF
ncbi:hypothetical protein BHE74_00008730 [Ensete ventricosum]|nr:hypothetical protein BHE74_00008730 [Ensete ventricosum]